MKDHPALKIGPKITAAPVVHGSGDFAWEVRQILLANKFDCLAIPLPESFQSCVQQAILNLPHPGIVVQTNHPSVNTDWSEVSADGNLELTASYVPIDPCQPVIAAIRVALEEHIPIRFIDLETSHFELHSMVFPDAYALKKVSITQFAAAVVPFLKRPDSEQWHGRVGHMAHRLRQLSVDFDDILFVTSVLEWPWIRQAFADSQLATREHQPTSECQAYSIDPESLYFLMGEIPFISSLYERARSNLENDRELSIDGVKELLIQSRELYQREYRSRAKRVTPRLLATCIKYIRNLSLIENRFSPDLISIVNAAKQVVGDGFALSVLQCAKQYHYHRDVGLPEIRFGMDQAVLPEGDLYEMVSRLPGPPIQWYRLNLTPKPDQSKQHEWQQRWNPFSQCSWPPEDVIIENFRQTVFDRALDVMGADLAKTEKFTTSVKDGIDIRDTIRHWYDGDIYVKTLPPNRGKLDSAVMLFDSPSDPRDYPWRTTWFAEHKEESTLGFYATDFANEPVGPGICLATYGGILFLYPPVAIPDIWTDREFDFVTTLEERLIAAACRYSSCRHIALLSAIAPGRPWVNIARHYGRKLVHLPLARFSDSTIQQLRMVHVLNGKEVRSFASEFIRRA